MAIVKVYDQGEYDYAKTVDALCAHLQESLTVHEAQECEAFLRHLHSEWEAAEAELDEYAEA